MTVIFKNPLGRLILANLSYGLLLACLWCACPVWAWNALGHKVIAQIALDNLTPSARLRMTSYNRVLTHTAVTNAWFEGAVWLDTLHQLRSMHYIDLPVSYDASAINKLKRKRMNAVIACQQALIRLHNLQASAVERALALRILLHVVGDLHQPMHAVTCVSKLHPKGDRGGNSVR